MSGALGILRRVFFFLALPVVLVTVWWFATADSTDYAVPPLSTIVDVFPETWFQGRITTDVLPSLYRLAAGYAIALVAGVALGVMVGLSRLVRGLLEPVLEFLRAIPPPVLVPILFLFAGIGNTQKIIVIVSGCVWPVLLNTVAGVRAADEVLGDTCRSYRVRGFLWLRTYVLRSASPQIMTGARQALAIGLILMVISELKAASDGIGFTFTQFQRSFQVPESWTGVIVLGVLGVVLALLFRVVERRVLVWYHGVRAAERDPR